MKKDFIHANFGAGAHGTFTMHSGYAEQNLQQFLRDVHAALPGVGIRITAEDEADKTLGTTSVIIERPISETCAQDKFCAKEPLICYYKLRAGMCPTHQKFFDDSRKLVRQ
ncbi:MAG: hypothetical protein LBL52_00595 [Rickettsiales bacterium]|jgi:hypothetical protein|nr:hypothetical protein [Rickettsiales bacterium]